jgi:hypothetical protein
MKTSTLVIATLVATVVLVFAASRPACAQAETCATLPTGAIFQRWTLTGGANGPMGCPTGPVQGSPGAGQSMSFASGQIVTAGNLGPNAAVAAYQAGADLVVDWGDTSPVSYAQFVVSWSLNGSASSQRTLQSGFTTRGVWFLPLPQQGTYAITVGGCLASGACPSVTSPPVNITYTPAASALGCTNDSLVTGATRTRWLSLGAGLGPLSCPTGAATTPGNSTDTLQTFNFGSIVNSPAGSGMTVAVYQNGIEPSFHVLWGNTSSSYDYFIVRWQQDAQADGQGGTNIGQSNVGTGNSGSFDISVSALTTYSVVVEGCNKGSFPSGSSCAGFTLPAPVVVRPNINQAGACTVGSTGPLFDRWIQLGGQNSPLGCPVAPQVSIPGTDEISQDCQHGQMVFAPDQGPDMVISLYESGGQLFIDWSTTSPASFDFFLIRDENGGQSNEQSNNGRSSSASAIPLFPVAPDGGAPVIPPGTYSFKVEGCNNEPAAPASCQGFSAPVSFTICDAGLISCAGQCVGPGVASPDCLAVSPPTPGGSLDFSNEVSAASAADVDNQFVARGEVAGQYWGCNKVLGNVTHDEGDFMGGALGRLYMLSHNVLSCPGHTNDYRSEVNEALRSQSVGSDAGTTCPGRLGEYDVALAGYIRIVDEYGQFLDPDVYTHIVNDLLNKRGPVDPNDFAVVCPVAGNPFLDALGALLGAPLLALLPGVPVIGPVIGPLAGLSVDPVSTGATVLAVAEAANAAGSNVLETENHLNQIESTRYLTNQILYAQTGDASYDNEGNGMNAFWLARLQNYLQHDFWEYNSRTYQAYTDTALQNLYDFAKDRRVKEGARLVLDYISAKFSVSNNNLRRLVPYRRHVSDYSTYLLADFQADRFLELSGLLNILSDPSFCSPDLLNPSKCDPTPDVVPSFGWAGGVLQAAESSYRVPDAVNDLIINQSHRTFYQRFSHYTVETYSSRPDYLISGGGFRTPAEEEVDLGNGACFGCDDAGRSVPISFMATGGLNNDILPVQTDLSDTFSFGGSTDQTKSVNTCVGPDFACGLNPSIPGGANSDPSIPNNVNSLPLSCRSGATENGGLWAFYDLASSACTTQSTFGFYIAAWLSQSLDPSTPSFGFFEVHPKDPNLTFPEFVTNTLEANNGSTFSYPGPNQYRKASGETIVWTIPDGSTTGATIWPFQTLGSNALDALGTDTTKWPLASGDVVNSVGHTGVVDFRNPGTGEGLVLDFGDIGEPTERVLADPTTLSPAQQAMSLSIPSDWTVSNGTGQSSPLSANGYGSLSVSGTGWVTITSVALSAADLRANAGPDLSSIAYDLYIPLPQPNPYWIGATQMYLSAPSAGINSAYLGEDELTGQPEQQFVTERFSVPAYAMPALTGNAKDVTIMIILNVNNGTQPWLLSDVRFGGN